MHAVLLCVTVGIISVAFCTLLQGTKEEYEKCITAATEAWQVWADVSHAAVDSLLLSGVTTDPADPAMRGGARGPKGAQNCGFGGINFFTENLTQQFSLP